MMSPLCLIALGANLTSPAGGPAETLRAALAALEEAGLAIRAVSDFYRTPAFPAGAGPDFVNAAAVIGGAPEGPAATLAVLHAVEARFARVRDRRWAGRTLDLDLLACGDAVLPDPATFARWRDLPAEAQAREAPDRLILPHPRLQDRAFVLVPLADVAPGWVHPVSGLDVRQMLAALPGAARAAAVRL